MSNAFGKKALILAIACALSVSFAGCSKTEDKVPSDSGNSLCQAIMKVSDAEELLTLGRKYFEQDANELSPANKNELENCFRSIKFNKKVSRKDGGRVIGGSAGQFAELAENEFEIKLDGLESKGFQIRIGISGKQKCEAQIKEVNGSLTLYDNSGNISGSYDILHYPNIAKLLEIGEGTEFVTVYLNPIWQSTAENPFEFAAGNLALMQSVEAFDISLNIVSSDEIISHNNNDIIELFEKQTEEFLRLKALLEDDDLEAMARYPEVLKKCRQTEEQILKQIARLGATDLKKFRKLQKELSKAAASVE